MFFLFRSKTGVSVNELGDQYVLLGPYVEQKARQEIEEEDFPFHHPLGQVTPIPEHLKVIGQLKCCSEIKILIHSFILKLIEKVINPHQTQRQ